MYVTYYIHGGGGLGGQGVGVAVAGRGHLPEFLYVGMSAYSYKLRSPHPIMHAMQSHHK